MAGVNKNDYYSIIAGLSAFEGSQNVTFTPEEMVELTKKREDKDEEDTEYKKNIAVHSYLGGKVDMKEASNVSYDLSHTLLGGYVPKKQLESLSSIDFADYFHKTLECENALQAYDLFLRGNGRMSMFLNQNNKETTKKPSDTDRDYQRVLPDGKIMRKVIICNKCNVRFRGPERVTNLKKHVCKGEIRK